MNNSDITLRQIRTIVSEREGEKVYGPPIPPSSIKDESLLNKSKLEDTAYLDDLAEAVCINGDKLEKYEKLVTVKFSEETYANIKLFVDELQRSIVRQKFTNTSKVNLCYLGKNVGLSEQTIDKIVEQYAQSIGINNEPPMPGPKPPTTLAPNAVKGLVLGILSICFCWLIVPGLILSLIGKKKIKNSYRVVAANPTAYRGEDMLKSGQKTTKIGFILSLVFIPIWIILLTLI